MVRDYFAHGYDEFDRLCRTAYAEVLPNWDCVILPWEQIIAERSRLPIFECELPSPECQTCRPLQYGANRELVSAAP
jgi:hypothetical protein